jgi:RNA polymerase sigma factor (sigma-70 family)
MTVAAPWGTFVGGRVTGLVATACREDGPLTLQPAVRPAARAIGYLPTAAVTGFARPAAVVPEQDVGALDVGLLVRRAAEGDRWAWERLVNQYARLIWAMTRDFKLVESDAADVAQATWLRLLEHIDRLEYPARVGSWLAVTARNECLRCVAARKRVVLVHDDVELKDAVAIEPEIDERLLADERAEAVREAISRLPPRWQRLLELLMADPPVSYAEISDQLGLPVGSIGPTRGRCLARLRVLLQA